MADNVAITAGAGTNIAADDISSVFYQRVKVALGPNGTYTADGAGRDLGSGDGALYVDERPAITRIQVSPTVSTTPAYTAGDSVGGVMTFAGVFRTNGDGSTIETVTVVDADSELDADASWLLFFSASPTATDNAAFDPTDAQLDNLVGACKIATTDWYDLADNAAAVVTPRILVTGTTDLYAVLVTKATPTFTATDDVTVTLTVTQH